MKPLVWQLTILAELNYVLRSQWKVMLLPFDQTLAYSLGVRKNVMYYCE